MFKWLVFLFCLVSVGCSKDSGSKKTNNQSKVDTQTPKAVHTGTRQGADTVESLVQRFPKAIANTERFFALLPSESALQDAMECTGPHPLIEMLKKAQGLMAKNIDSAKNRIGLGSVEYEGVTIRDTQKISKGEVDKGCTAKIDIEIKRLTAKLKFISRSGKAKVSGGIVTAVRLGQAGWFVLKM